MTAGRDHWYHELDVSDDPATCPCEPMDERGPALPHVHVGDDREAEGDRPHDRRLPRRRRVDPPLHLRPEAGDGRLLVRGRHRLDHRPQLHRLRAALQRRHVRALRGNARLPGPRALVVDRRALRRHDPLHRSDRDPRPHEVGARARRSSTTSPRCGSSARWASRSTPRRGSGTPSTSAASRCPVVDTWWQTETGMILITPLPGRHDDEAGLGDEAVSRGSRPRCTTSRASEVEQGGRLPRARAAVAGDDARDLRRRRALPRDVLVALPGRLLRGRRRPHRRGRRLLAARPRRRRDERLRAPHLDDRGRVARSSTIRRWPRPPCAAARTRRRARRSSPTSRSRAADQGSVAMLEELRNHVAEKIGPIAKPANIVFTPELPKTRSGKIMRRLLRDVAEHRPLGDTTTLADPAVVERDRRARGREHRASSRRLAPRSPAQRRRRCARRRARSSAIRRPRCGS